MCVDKHAYMRLPSWQAPISKTVRSSNIKQRIFQEEKIKTEIEKAGEKSSLRKLS